MSNHHPSHDGPSSRPAGREPISALIERSSLGTRSARRSRSRVPVDDARAVIARAVARHTEPN